jgi:hypothetical protein
VEGDHRNRDVDHEHGAPADALHERAAQQRPGRQGRAADPRPQPDRPRAIAGVREGMADHGERAGEQERRAYALQDAEADQRGGARRHRAAQRGDAEQRQPPEHDALVATDVANHAGAEHQAGQRDRVAVDDPLQAADARVQPRADLRQRDVDDRHVEQDQEVPDAHDDQHDPGRGLESSHALTRHAA